jgi:tetratricopeptide (TPR) repeat protein
MDTKLDAEYVGGSGEEPFVEWMISYHHHLVCDRDLTAHNDPSEHNGTDATRGMSDESELRDGSLSSIVEFNEDFSDADPQIVESLITTGMCLRALEQCRRADASARNAQFSGESEVRFAGDWDGAALAALFSFEDAPQPKQFEVGRFVVHRELGRGGLGIVCLAYDTVLRRQVALKLPRPDVLMTPELRKRFQREAQAAARLAHPNIVPVYEVGEAGALCFIAAEVIHGPNLAEWLAQQGGRIDAREAALIVADLAEAMAYAHLQGVMHRDLKPTNILMDPNVSVDGGPANTPGGGAARITDFGLAKIADQGGDDTRIGTVLGTPEYMSPEQAAGRSGQIGPATDIYALGVILHELVTGSVPSHAVTKNESAPRAVRAMDRDLAAICRVCIEPEVSHRYQSAGELASDLRRYLRGESTVARPLSVAQKLGRWTRRNPLIAALLALLLLALVSVATVSTIAALRISDARDEARQTAAAEAIARGRAEQAGRRATEAQRSAEQQAANARQVSEFLVDLFNSADPVGFGSLGFRTGHEVGTSLTLGELLDRGARSARRALADQPLTLATMLDTLGAVYCNLGDFTAADPLLKEAYEIRLHHGGSESDLATSQLNLGVLHRWQTRHAEAEPLLRQALETRRRLYGPDDLRVADASFALGMLLTQRRLVADPVVAAEVDELFETAYRIRLAKLGDQHRDVGTALTFLAMSRFRDGDLAGAQEKLLEAVNIFAQQEGGEELLLAVAQILEGMMQRKNGNLAGAIDVYQQVLASLRKTLGDQHLLSLIVMGELAGTLKDDGHTVAAERVARELFDLAEQAFPGGSPLLVEPLGQLAWWCEMRGNTTEAEKLRRDGDRMMPGGRKHGKIVNSELFSVGLRIIEGRFDEASRLLEQQRIGPDDVEAGRALESDFVAWSASARELAHCLGDLPQAEAFARRIAPQEPDSLAQLIFEQRPDDAEIDALVDVSNIKLMPNYPNHSYPLIVRARWLASQGRFAEAQQTLAPALDYLETKTIPGNWYLGDAQSAMGMLLAKQSADPERAESLLRSGLANLRQSRGERHWLTRAAAQALIDFFRERQRFDEADELAPLTLPPVLAGN